MTRDPNPPRICFVGDSYVAGTGDPTCLGWVGRVCAQAWSQGSMFSWYNLGIRGDTSELIAKRWRQECEARLPSAVPGRLVFSFGANDIAVLIGTGLRVPLDRSVSVARTMLSEASQWLPTLWIGPTPANERISPLEPIPGVLFDARNDRLLALSGAYASVARDLGIPYLDLATPLTADPVYQQSLLEGDRIHCSAKGYEIIASHVSKWHPWEKLIAGKA
jgi:acyl-CoA thioesterase I